MLFESRETGVFRKDPGDHMQSDVEYFQRRSEFERAQAAAAEDPIVAAVHEELARGYEALVRRENMREQSPNMAANAPVRRKPIMTERASNRTT